MSSIIHLVGMVGAAHVFREASTGPTRAGLLCEYLDAGALVASQCMLVAIRERVEVPRIEIRFSRWVFVLFRVSLPVIMAFLRYG